MFFSLFRQYILTNVLKVTSSMLSMQVEIVKLFLLFWIERERERYPNLLDRGIEHRPKKVNFSSANRLSGIACSQFVQFKSYLRRFNYSVLVWFIEQCLAAAHVQHIELCACFILCCTKFYHPIHCLFDIIIIIIFRSTHTPKWHSCIAQLTLFWNGAVYHRKKILCHNCHTTHWKEISLFA